MKHVLALLVLVLAAVSTPAQTYTQTTHACNMQECNDAQFSGTTATLSYLDHAATCGQQNFTGSATWNGTTYEDFIGSIKFLGYINPVTGQNSYPDGYYQLTATFGAGHYSLLEVTRNYRGCSGGTNIEGSVTVQ